MKIDGKLAVLLSVLMNTKLLHIRSKNILSKCTVHIESHTWKQLCLSLQITLYRLWIQRRMEEEIVKNEQKSRESENIVK